MRVVFIGGPLDGELRVVEMRSDLQSGWQPYIASEGSQYNGYSVSNGIARHESVSEDEVARMIAAWRKAWAVMHTM